YLLETGGPEQKAVIFCVRDSHADAVTNQMNNLYAAWCAANGRKRAEPYAFKCTQAGGGANYLPDLRGSTHTHFIAATVELLSTGVDVPALQNVAFFRYMRSPISFYQMVGRGTRLNPDTGKLMFRVYDYTDATRLFGDDFFTKPTPARPRVLPVDGEYDDGGGNDHEEPLIISVEGFDVHVTTTGKYVVTMKDGKAQAMPVEEYKALLAERLRVEAPTLEAFRKQWIEARARRALVQRLVTAGFSPSLVRAVDGMGEYDLFDVLGRVAYQLPPQTRRQRFESFRVAERLWLGYFLEPARNTLLAIAQQFARSGVESLESPELFETTLVKKAGGLRALKDEGPPLELLRETKARLFAA
ncbi:MAG: type I restriction-modification enzyme R subunit C-terminal domain-containing protein, partial [Anaerolineales bacterium]